MDIFDCSLAVDRVVGLASTMISFEYQCSCGFDDNSYSIFHCFYKELRMCRREINC